MAKRTLRYTRHSKKDGEIIGTEGLELAQNQAPKGEYSDLFHGPMPRTCQTVLAVATGLGLKAKVHPPIDEIGDKELFGQMANDAFKEAAKKGMSNIEALKIAQPIEKVREWALHSLEGVKKMFELMQGNFGFAAGHDPVIPLAAMAAGYENAHSLDTLEYYDFVMDENGDITVTAG